MKKYSSVAPVAIIDQGQGVSRILSFWDIVDKDDDINQPPKENSLNLFSSDQQRELFQTVMIGLTPMITYIVGQLLSKVRSVISRFLVNNNLGQIALALETEDFGMRPAEQGQEMVPLQQDEQ